MTTNILHSAAYRHSLFKLASLRPASSLAKPSTAHISSRRVTGRRHLTALTAATMDARVEETVERIHSTPFKLVLYVTGGAAQAPAWLLSVPGASRTVLEVRVPYSQSSLEEIIGRAPQSSATEAVSKEMALAAYRQAASLSTFGTPIVGVGATCALATDRDRRGEHKVYVTVHTGTTTRTASLLLAKGGRSRLAEDTLASRVVVDAVASAMGACDSSLEASVHESGLLEKGDTLEVKASSKDRAQLMNDMLSGRVRTLEFSGAGANAIVDAPRPGRIYLPGSFNPLHAGHRELLAAACRLFPGKEGAFELSIGNADKGVLALPEIERRVAQFAEAGLPVVLTQAPLFTMKADLFPRSTFVVGYDTAERLIQEKYYGAEIPMLLQFARLAHQKCDFLVAGRRDDATGKFLTMADLEVPEVLRRGSLFRGLPQEEFRVDISSTELRQHAR